MFFHRYLNTVALKELKELIHKLLALFEINYSTKTITATFPELGEGSNSTVLRGSIADGSTRKEFITKLLTWAIKVRNVVINKPQEALVKQKLQLKFSLEWLTSTKSYNSFVKSRESEREQFVNQQVDLFIIQYDAATKIRENWKQKFPGIRLQRRTA